MSMEPGDAVQKGEGRAASVGSAGAKGGGALTSGFCEEADGRGLRQGEGDGAHAEPLLPGASLGLTVPERSSVPLRPRPVQSSSLLTVVSPPLPGQMPWADRPELQI